MPKPAATRSAAGEAAPAPQARAKRLKAVPAAAELFYGAPASTRKGQECVVKVLEATKGVLISHGYAGLTLRLVAERADMAHSNVQYYFPTKEQLTHSLMLYLSAGYQRDIDEIFGDVPDDPMERFVRFVRYFIDVNRTEEVTVIFFELRAMSQRSDFILDELDAMYSRYRVNFEVLLEAVNPSVPAAERALRAALVISLIDGLMMDFIGAKNDRHEALAELGAFAEREIVRIAMAPA